MDSRELMDGPLSIRLSAPKNNTIKVKGARSRARGTAQLADGVVPLLSGGVFKSAAVEVLRQAGRLMATGEICRFALEWGLLKCSGKTPEATMASCLYSDIKRNDELSVFIRPQEGLFGLREWIAQGILPPDASVSSIVGPLRRRERRKSAAKGGHQLQRGWGGPSSGGAGDQTEESQNGQEWPPGPSPARLGGNSMLESIYLGAGVAELDGLIPISREARPCEAKQQQQGQAAMAPGVPKHRAGGFPQQHLSLSQQDAPAAPVHASNAWKAVTGNAMLNNSMPCREAAPLSPERAGAVPRRRLTSDHTDLVEHFPLDTNCITSTPPLGSSQREFWAVLEELEKKAGAVEATLGRLHPQAGQAHLQLYEAFQQHPSNKLWAKQCAQKALTRAYEIMVFNQHVEELLKRKKAFGLGSSDEVARLVAP